jgi:hypothetical protein
MSHSKRSNFFRSDTLITKSKRANKLNLNIYFNYISTKQNLIEVFITAKSFYESLNKIKLFFAIYSFFFLAILKITKQQLHYKYVISSRLICVNYG